VRKECRQQAVDHLQRPGERIGARGEQKAQCETQVLALGVAVLGVLLATLPTRCLFFSQQYLYYSKHHSILKATDQSRTRSRAWVS